MIDMDEAPWPFTAKPWAEAMTPGTRPAAAKDLPGSRGSRRIALTEYACVPLPSFVVAGGRTPFVTIAASACGGKASSMSEDGTAYRPSARVVVPRPLSDRSDVTRTVATSIGRPVRVLDGR